MSDSVANEKIASPASGGAPHAVLGLREATALIVGVVIGAGVFKAPAMVAGMTGEASWMFGAWILGGVISLIGALCYAELTTAYPHAGGDYHFLNRAYGRSVSFMFGWARFSVITTGSIALLAFVFGDYMQQIFPLNPIGPATGPALYAGAAILVLSGVNLRNIRTGMLTQTWLTVLEVFGLLLIVAAALVLVSSGSDAPAAAAATAAPAPVTATSFGLAMVFVLLTYGGWNEAAYISAEMKSRRSMVLALTLSILIITSLYLMVTWAYWQGLGMQGMAKSEAIAADLMRIVFGFTGEKIISVLIAVAALTSINATMIVGARTSYAMGRDWRMLSALGVWDDARGTPVNALRIQCIAALLLIIAGAAMGGGFKAMVEFTAPVFWLFFLLTGLSLFVLRIREPVTKRPFQVPLYPLLPVLFCATCAYMLWSSLSYVYNQSMGGINAAWIGVAVLASGGVLLGLMRHLHPSDTQPAVPIIQPEEAS